ncbi:MAG: Ig-like domain-containing protein [Erysipelotrichales bacterium]|nr:Ig-like domain-containing protein [Erysipelotrichales bacterium]
MKKFNKKVPLLFASFALMMGIGLVGEKVSKSVKAEENVQFNFSSGMSAAMTDGPVTVSMSEYNTYTPLRIYANSTFTISVDSPATSITKLVVTANQTGNYVTNTANTAFWSVAPTVSTSGKVVTLDFSGSATTITFTPTAQARWDNLTVYYNTSTAPDPEKTVSSVAIASHPDTVYQGGSISGDDVELTLTYDDSTTGTAKAHHVNVDTSVVKDDVVATAYYDEKESLYDTFTVNVIEAPETDAIEDVLNNANTINSTANTYKGWDTTGNFNSGATYKGYSAGQYSSIQLRSTTAANSSDYAGVVSVVSGGTIKEIRVAWNSNTSDARSVKIYFSDSAFASPNDLYNKDVAKAEEGSIAKSSGTTYVPKGQYAHFGMTSTNGALYLDSITVVWEKAVEKDKPSISIETTIPSVMRVGETLDLETKTRNAEGATVEWSVNNTSVASIDVDGKVTALAAGTFVATAKINVNGTDYSVSTPSIQVKEALMLEHAGTEDDPLTVEDAIKVCVDAGNANTTESYYVKGIVTNIVEISPSFGNATMDIADTADGVDVLRLYRIYYLGGEKFTAEDQVAVGDTVVCYGKLINYGNKTPEMPTGSQLTEHTTPSEEVEVANVTLELTNKYNDHYGRFSYSIDRSDVTLEGKTAQNTKINGKQPLMFEYLNDHEFNAYITDSDYKEKEYVFEWFENDVLVAKGTYVNDVTEPDPDKPVEPVKLNAPVGLVINTTGDGRKILAFADVTNASGYHVQYRQGEKVKYEHDITNGGYLNPNDDYAAGTYDVYVKTLGDGEHYLDSDYALVGPFEIIVEVDPQVEADAFVQEWLALRNDEGSICDQLNGEASELKAMIAKYDALSPEVKAIVDASLDYEGNTIKNSVEYLRSFLGMDVTPSADQPASGLLLTAVKDNAGTIAIVMALIAGTFVGYVLLRRKNKLVK